MKDTALVPVVIFGLISIGYIVADDYRYGVIDGRLTKLEKHVDPAAKCKHLQFVEYGYLDGRREIRCLSCDAVLDAVAMWDATRSAR